MGTVVQPAETYVYAVGLKVSRETAQFEQTRIEYTKGDQRYEVFGATRFRVSPECGYG